MQRRLNGAFFYGVVSDAQSTSLGSYVCANAGNAGGISGLGDR